MSKVKKLILLELEDVNLILNNSRIIRDLNLKVADEQIVGIIGSAEAGKTVLFDIISGFYKATKGKIIFRGKNIIGMHPHEINKLGIAYVFQHNNNFSDLSVEDNIRIGLYNKISYGPLDALLKTEMFINQESLLDKKIDDLLDMFDLRKYKKIPAKDLSKDLQVRLGLARAMASSPRLLLLDNLTDSLDKNQTQDFISRIETINRRYKTSIVITDDNIELLSNVCSQISVMEYGMIIATDTPEVIRNNSVLRSIYSGEKLGGGF